MSNLCPACLGREFSFKHGPCNLCNQPILGFAIHIKAAPTEREKFDNPEMETQALIRGIAEAIAETLQEVAQTVGKPY